MSSVYHFVLTWLQLLLIHDVTSMGPRPPGDCRYLQTPTDGPREILLSGTLDICFRNNTNTTVYYTKLSFAVPDLTEGDITIYEDCGSNPPMKYHQIAILNSDTDKVVIGNAGCPIWIQPELADGGNYTLKYEFIEGCPVFREPLDQDTPVTISCDGNHCSCIKIEGMPAHMVNLNISGLNLDCNGGGHMCKFNLQISEMLTLENDAPSTLLRNITSEENVAVPSNTSGSSFLVQIVKVRNLSMNSGESLADIRFTFRMAPRTATSPLTPDTQPETSDNVGSPTSTPQSSDSEDISTPTTATTTVTSNTQAAQDSSETKPSATWIIIVLVVVLLAVAVMVVIFIRKRRRDPVDRVNSGKKIVVNATYSSSGTGPSTQGPVHLDGDNVVYNSAYQTSDSIVGNGMESHRHNPVEATSTGKPEHEYTYAGTSDGAGDIERGQIYNSAYQSMDDSNSKPITAKRDPEHEYAYADSDNLSSKNGDNQKGQVYNSAYQSADDLEVKGKRSERNDRDVYHYAESQNNANLSALKRSGGDEYSYAAPVSAIPSSLRGADEEGQVYNTAYQSVESPEPKTSASE